MGMKYGGMKKVGVEFMHGKIFVNKNLEYLGTPVMEQGYIGCYIM